MLNPILAGLTAFFVSFAFLPFIIQFSKKKRFVALPGKRRIHKKITPSLGGVAIFFGFTIAGICWSTHPKSSVIFLLLPILIIPFIIGLIDDIIHLKPLAKLLAQWITASLLFFVLDIQIRSFYGLITDLTFSVPVSYAATLFTVLLITNALNLIDGIDGLAATFSFIASIFFGTWFLFSGNDQFAILCYALAGGILAFLFQNWEPSTIFMGDTGSLVIGTILSVMTIRFINENTLLTADNPLRFNSSIGTAICALIIPLADTTRIVIIRLYRRIPPFTPDKRHIHHALVRIGLSHRQTVYVLTLIHVTLIGIALTLREADEWILLLTVAIVAIAFSVILELLISRYVQKEAPLTVQKARN